MYKEAMPSIEPDMVHRNIVPHSLLRNSFRMRKEGLKKFVNTEHGYGTLNEEEALSFN